MSISLDLQCETFSPLGNISGRGIQKILGTPNIDRLRLVIRETVQNTWDARLRDGEAPRYCAGIRLLDTAQRELLLGSLLADIPPSGDTRRRISELHKRERIYVLEISDYGTSGLGGPVRANMLESEGEVRDFVDFFRNVGSPRDIHHGGGTYGYGKSSLYLMSRCRTIFAYSRTHVAQKPVSRIFGAAISDPFAHGRSKYTGRYWWGQRQSDRVVDPVEGAQADRLSRVLGMPPRSREDLGTTVLIVDPDFDHRSPKQAVDAIRESLLWYFWPKMIPPRRRQGSPMKFEVMLDRQQIALPALKECPPLGAFSEAFNQVVDEQGARPIECQRPIQLLGQLGLAKVPLRERVRFDTGDDSPLIPAQSCHVALMRPAELVVKYIEGPALPTDSVEYGGVFICDEEVEEAFAAAEPPAHDDWIPDNLTGRDKTFVRVALRRIRDIVNEYAAPPQVAATAGEGLLPLGAFGDALGGLLLGQPGQGLSEPPSGPRASKQARHTAVRIGRPKPVGFSMVRRSPCALFKVDISGRTKETLFVVGEAQVVVEGGGGTLNPIGVDPPTVVAWLDEKGGTLATGARLELQPVAPMSVFAAVSIPTGCAVALNVAEETLKV